MKFLVALTILAVFHGGLSELQFGHQYNFENVVKSIKEQIKSTPRFGHQYNFKEVENNLKELIKDKLKFGHQYNPKEVQDNIKKQIEENQKNLKFGHQYNPKQVQDSIKKQIEGNQKNLQFGHQYNSKQVHENLKQQVNEKFSFGHQYNPEHVKKIIEEQSEEYKKNLKLGHELNLKQVLENLNLKFSQSNLKFGHQYNPKQVQDSIKKQIEGNQKNLQFGHQYNAKQVHENLKQQVNEKFSFGHQYNPENVKKIIEEQSEEYKKNLKFGHELNLKQVLENLNLKFSQSNIKLGHRYEAEKVYNRLKELLKTKEGETLKFGHQYNPENIVPTYSRIFEDTINETIECIRYTLETGLEEYDIPSVQELRVDDFIFHLEDLNLDGWAGFAHVTDLLLVGLTSFYAPQIQGDLSLIPPGFKLDMNLVFQTFDFLTNYDFDLLGDNMPIFGTGKISWLMENISMRINTFLNLSDGLHLEDLSILINIGSSEVDITGWFHDDDHSELFNDLINNYLIPHWVNQQPEAISDLISPILQELINGLLAGKKDSRNIIDAIIANCQDSN